MKRALATAVIMILLAALAPMAPAADKEPTVRSLVGQVMNRNTDAALPNAVVYLKNTKSLAVKTFIADAQGNYRFPALSFNVDYEVFAEYNGKRSDTKTLSSFDNRPEPRINLKIDLSK